MSFEFGFSHKKKLFQSDLPHLLRQFHCVQSPQLQVHFLWTEVVFFYHCELNLNLAPEENMYMFLCKEATGHGYI